MTTREFVQHLILNGELDDPVRIEVYVQPSEEGYVTFNPAHVARVGEYTDEAETLIECKRHDYK